MADTVEVQYQRILPPMQKAIAAVQVTNAVQVIDLTTLVSGDAASGGNSQPDQSNVVGKYVTIYADCATPVYHAFGNNFNALLNISVTAYTTVNATTGALTINGNECFPVPPIGWYDELVSPSSPLPASNSVAAKSGTPSAQVPRGGASVARYVALMMGGAATGVARFYQSST